MSALTADRATAERKGDEFSYDAAAVAGFAGGIAMLNASGNVTPGATATGQVCVGMFVESFDNSAGAAADIQAKVRAGVFRFGNSAAADAITKAHIGDTCYIVDDQTVALTNGTNTRSAAGTIVDVDSLGVWVRMGL